MLAHQAAWGIDFKRLIRAAAAMRGLYDDKAIGEAVGRSRNTVAAWWKGTRPEPDTLAELASTTGLDADDLFAWVYRGGEPPPSGPAGLAGGRGDPRRSPTGSG